ncbi:MAG TPA: hypothetical protein VHB25_00185 [Gemmatimonadaceae bacterium]|nr:hypothetical protein [Gemmatimonadaceae bacterium]
MSSVLVLAEHPEIEALLADLVLFAGYHPVFVRADETAVDALRRRAIDVLLIDAATPPITRCACEDTARERAAGVVYFASTMNAAELRAFAEVREGRHFALPNGPKMLRAVLDDATRSLGRGPGSPT